MSTLTERLAALSPARRRKVDRRYRELKVEQMRLDELRKSLGLTQAAVARKLKVKQPRISKIERGPDAVLETMRRYLAALGGELEIVAKFGDGRRVKIRSEADLKRAES
jgi:transcriptional regulator with XRE-family HTH domain